MDRGDCIESIQRRLLSKSAFPSYEEIYFSQIEAEDLFRMKVDIIHKMSVLDPTGGEESAERTNPRPASSPKAN
ncbi:hypothetical protein Leryth_025667 [Lithospermum erythrorhizon]|nr:hypothetical protein Leryth_025667 [Lithospermum erythrorhizon]